MFIQVACRFESPLPVGAYTPTDHLLHPGLSLSVLLLLFDGCQNSLIDPSISTNTRHPEGSNGGKGHNAQILRELKVMSSEPSEEQLRDGANYAHLYSYLPTDCLASHWPEGLAI